MSSVNLQTQPTLQLQLQRPEARASQSSVFHDAQEYITMADALHITEQRLKKVSTGNQLWRRLSQRFAELQQLQQFMNSNGFECTGFSGWKSGNRVQLSRHGQSQFETVFLRDHHGDEIELPLQSGLKHFQKKETHLFQHIETHDDHAHEYWLSESILNKLTAKKAINENEEGCPCCMAGLDFDEFAAALKEVSGSQSGHEHFADLPAIDSAQHWGVLLGITGPLGVIGLAAAIRNIKGTIKTRHHLKLILKSLNHDIELLKNKGQYQDAFKLIAFRKTLQYSKFDTNFNLIVPGIINGAASVLVLSTAFASHPLALPAIAVYASCQFFRNVYDLFRIRNFKVKKNMRDSIDVIRGKQKINQITTSKQKFYTTNAFGFACFTAGAIITFLSIPAIGFFGAGAATLPIGLSLLTFGALFTGISNNIWPRKFKPRNGDLGVDRANIQSSDQVLELLDARRKVKKTLQLGLPFFKPDHQQKKRLLKFLTALPELKDFLPTTTAASISKTAHRYIPFLPYTGSGASEKKHHLNLAMTHTLHQDPQSSAQLQKLRVSILQQLSGEKQTSEDAMQASWEHLQALGFEKNVLEVWINEGFISTANKVQPHHDHHDHHDRHGHHHRIEFNSIPGFQKHQHWLQFNFKEFKEHASEQEKQRFNSAIDYFLFYQYEKKMRYQQYGLADYYWQL